MLEKSWKARHRVPLTASPRSHNLARGSHLTPARSKKSMATKWRFRSTFDPAVRARMRAHVRSVHQFTANPSLGTPSTWRHFIRFFSFFPVTPSNGAALGAIAPAYLFPHLLITRFSPIAESRKSTIDRGEAST